MAIFFLFILLLLLIPVVIYNQLIRKKNAVDNAFFSIDVQLRKRYDLIPQLVETVKGYMQHEKEVLLELTKLRQQAIDPGLSVNDRITLDNQIETALTGLFVQMENYPVLKASENFLRLQGAINETEEQLAASRRFYNAAVTDYHNAIESFPSNLMANAMGLKHRTWFQIAEEQKQRPEIILS